MGKREFGNEVNVQFCLIILKAYVADQVTLKAIETQKQEEEDERIQICFRAKQAMDKLKKAKEEELHRYMKIMIKLKFMTKNIHFLRLPTYRDSIVVSLILQTCNILADWRPQLYKIFCTREKNI